MSRSFSCCVDQRYIHAYVSISVKRSAVRARSLYLPVAKRSPSSDRRKHLLPPPLSSAIGSKNGIPSSCSRRHSDVVFSVVVTNRSALKSTNSSRFVLVVLIRSAIGDSLLSVDAISTCPLRRPIKIVLSFFAKHVISDSFSVPYVLHGFRASICRFLTRLCALSWPPCVT